MAARLLSACGAGAFEHLADDKQKQHGVNVLLMAKSGLSL